MKNATPPNGRRDLAQEMDDFEDWPPSWKPDVGEALVGNVISYDRGFTQYGDVRTVIIKDEETGERKSLWLNTKVLLDLFNRLKPKPGERIGLKYLGKEETKGYHRYHMIVDRPETLDFSPLGGEAEDRQPQPPLTDNYDYPDDDDSNITF